jgi:ATP-dependent Lon protease
MQRTSIMRDFRDAKSMAHTLRESLNDKAMVISHSESLELVSRMLGVADWNTLSAELKDIPRPLVLPLPGQPNGGLRYPAIPIRDLVPFPTMTFPLFIGREKTRQALELAFAGLREVVLAVQKDAAVDDPKFDDLYEVGTLARLMEVERLADDTLKVLVQVQRRVTVSRFVGEHGTFQAEIADIAEGRIPDAPDLVGQAIERFRQYAATHDFRMVATVPPLDQIRDPGRLADVIVSQMLLPLRSKQAVLATLGPVERLEQVLALMDNAVAPERSVELAATLERALAHARERRHGFATLEHLLLAMTDDADGSAAMRSCGVDLGVLRESLIGYIDTGLRHLLTERETDPQPSAAFQRVIQRAGMQAWDMHCPATSGAELLAALFGEWKSPAVQVLVQQHMTQKDALNVIVQRQMKLA